MLERDLATVDDIEVEPLTDSDLESTSGGLAANTQGCPTTAGCPCDTTVGCPPVLDDQN
jgi:hypothetical protein